MLKVQIVQWIVSHAYNRDWFFLFFIRFLPLWVRKPYEKRKSKFPRILDPLAAGNAHVPIGPAIRPDLRSTLPRLRHLVLPLSFPFSSYSVTELVTQGLQCDGLVKIDYALPFWISTGGVYGVSGV
ncbi:hypothetical protein ACN38_g7957 [Penicillium nordicum]|uniref:Uncharacterized protein n=1 Tax=Penicillium nordicum TaxID=229535 RepID=A0A0M8P4J8_9EURO|nr:hypothetical protein ACN38_g7957 [Penicillium nordicum]